MNAKFALFNLLNIELSLGKCHIGALSLKLTLDLLIQIAKIIHFRKICGFHALIIKQLRKVELSRLQ